MEIEHRIGLPDIWYVQVFVISIYLWTGVGIFHKLVKTKKGQNIINKIQKRRDK